MQLYPSSWYIIGVNKGFVNNLQKHGCFVCGTESGTFPSHEPNRTTECNGDCEGAMDLLLHTPTERGQTACVPYDISQAAYGFGCHSPHDSCTVLLLAPHVPAKNTPDILSLSTHFEHTSSSLTFVFFLFVPLICSSVTATPIVVSVLALAVKIVMYGFNYELFLLQSLSEIWLQL